MHKTYIFILELSNLYKVDYFKLGAHIEIDWTYRFEKHDQCDYRDQ
jgi:hypothetical protein